MPKIKKSYGVICCRKDPVKGVQIVLVKKPVTYHFCEFISGHYRKSDDVHLKKLFNNMTYHEKMDILSLKFTVMWYRIYKTNPEQVFLQGSGSFHSKQYTRKKTKFEASFLQDGGARLKKLISSTVNAETLWEVPKGRRSESTNEEYINAAIREFTEETLIESSKYQMLWRINPYIETYSDFGTTYQNIYYYADAIGTWEPNIIFSNGQQISEVSAVRWCSLTDIYGMQLDPSTHARLVKLFKKITKKYKNAVRGI
jgi:ADP-ribose pyrophosphatase YjhB (NUDIX family)